MPSRVAISRQYLILRAMVRSITPTKPASGNNYAGIKSLTRVARYQVQLAVWSDFSRRVKANARRRADMRHARQYACPGPNPAPGCMAGLIVMAVLANLRPCQRGNVGAGRALALV